MALRLSSPAFLGSLGRTLDTDFLDWAAEVENAGATFGPTTQIASNNKLATSKLIAAMKNAPSDIPGRSIWQQLTTPGEGFILPLAGISTFAVPALFGEVTFLNFVSGHFNPRLGLTGGFGADSRAILTNRNFGQTPQNDFSIGMWLSVVESVGSVNGNGPSYFGTGTLAADPSVVMNRLGNTRTKNGAAFAAGSPNNYLGLVGVSRSSPSSSAVKTGATIQTDPSSSIGQPETPVSFLSGPAGVSPIPRTTSFCFYGRSVPLNTMQTLLSQWIGALQWN